MRAAAPAAWLTSLQTSENSPERASAEHRVEQELQQQPPVMRPAMTSRGAEPEHDDDAGEGEEHRRRR